MTTRPATSQVITLSHLSACTDVAGIFTLFHTLRYPVAAVPIAVPLNPEDLPGGLRDAVAERYIVADRSQGGHVLTVTLFVLHAHADRSTTIRGIAQAWTRRFAGDHLFVFTQEPTDDHGFRQITFVNTRRLGEGAQVRIKLYKLIVDRLNPTRHDCDTLNATAAPARHTGWACGSLSHPVRRV